MNTNFELWGNNTVRIAVVGVLAILALFLLAETVVSAQNFGRPGNPPTNVITVSGSGQASVAPDIARVTFSVIVESATVADAQTAASKQAQTALDAIKEVGIADKDVTTLSYNISPQYSYPPCFGSSLCPQYSGTPHITGYQVSETVQVTIHDLSKAATVLQKLGLAQVQDVSGPNFGLEDQNAGQEAARGKAIDDAKKQAEVLASQLGVHLGRIVSYSENGGGYAYPMAYASGMATKDSATIAPPLPSGENTYNASVSITYEIR